jgi:hypothetical protein
MWVVNRKFGGSGGSRLYEPGRKGEYGVEVQAALRETKVPYKA